MSVQQYCLRWNNHQPNFISVFSSLLHNESLVDVTLAAEGRQLQAHKIVLSACSSYFQSLFQTNPCKHPIVILKDVQYNDLKTMVDFMYYGEVNVSTEQLPTILKTAEMLKIKGLAEMPDAGSAVIKSESKIIERTDAITGGGVGSESIWGSTESQQQQYLQQQQQQQQQQLQQQQPSQRRTPSPNTIQGMSPAARRKRLRKSSTGSGSTSTERIIEETNSTEGVSINLTQMENISTFTTQQANAVANNNSNNSNNSTRLIKDSTIIENEPQHDSSQEGTDNQSVNMKTTNEIVNVTQTIPIDIANTPIVGATSQSQHGGAHWTVVDSNYSRFSISTCDTNLTGLTQHSGGQHQHQSHQHNNNTNSNNENQLLNTSNSNSSSNTSSSSSSSSSSSVANGSATNNQQTTGSLQQQQQISYHNPHQQQQQQQQHQSHQQSQQQQQQQQQSQQHINHSSGNGTSNAVITVAASTSTAYSPQIISVNPNNMINSYPSTPTSPHSSTGAGTSSADVSLVQSVYSQGTTPSQSPNSGGASGSGNNSQSLPPKRKRSVNPQGDENFLRALDAVRFGGIGFCKAARLYGVNNRTLWLEYKKRGYPISRPSIKNRIKLEPNISPPPPTTPSGDENTIENYENVIPQTPTMVTLPPPPTDLSGTSLMCPPHAHHMNVMGFLDTRHVDFSSSLHPVMPRQRYPETTVNMNQGPVNLQGINFNSM